MSESKNIYQRLLEVQKTAKAPREKDGKFGKARSAEQIEEAFKPVCNANGLYLYTSDKVERFGERNYITSTATVVNVDKPDESHSASASAWENEVEQNKYGQAILDTSQVSGKTGSYAKKYALQNLFAIDDTKDADFDEKMNDVRPAKQEWKPSKTKEATDKQREFIGNLLRQRGIEGKEAIGGWLMETYGIIPGQKLSEADAQMILDDLTKKEPAYAN